MIAFQEIEEGEVVKALVNFNDVEEELFARVYANKGTFLEVKYLLPTEKHWKGACAYELDETMELLEPEALVEHYPGVLLFDEVDGIRRIPHTPYYFFASEARNLGGDSDSEEEVQGGSDDEGSWYTDEEGDEGPQEHWEPPPDHREVDQAWREWQPTTSGAKRFKERVDLIEYFARMHADEENM